MCSRLTKITKNSTKIIVANEYSLNVKVAMLIIVYYTFRLNVIQLRSTLRSRKCKQPVCAHTYVNLLSNDIIVDVSIFKYKNYTCTVEYLRAPPLCRPFISAFFFYQYHSHLILAPHDKVAHA